MKKRVGAIEEFAVETLSEGASLRCILAVSGWIDKDTVASGEWVTVDLFVAGPRVRLQAAVAASCCG